MSKDIRYAVVSGPNASHLHDVHWESKYKDALAYAGDLSLSPNGEERPYRVERHDFSNNSIIMKKSNMKDHIK